MYDLAQDYLNKNQDEKKQKSIQQTIVPEWGAVILFEINENYDISKIPNNQYGNQFLKLDPEYVDYGLIDKQFLTNL